MPKWNFVFIIIMLVSLVGCTAASASPEQGVQATATPTRVPATFTPLPTATPSPTSTQTPPPTQTLFPTATPTQTPIPVVELAPVDIPADGSWATRLNHIFQFQFSAPAAWQPVHATRYGSTREAPELTFAALEYPDLTDIRTLCETLPGSTETLAGVGQIGRIGDRDICLIAPDSAPQPTTALLLYPRPVTVRGHVYRNGTYNILQISTGNGQNLLPVVQSITFPEVPSARLFVEGVFDLLESSYFFRDQVQWGSLRQEVLEPLNANSTMEEAYTQVRYLVRRLRDVVGERHMFVRGARVIDEIQSGQDADLGIIFNDVRQIVIVIPDSPAAEAGLQIGDVVISINGGDPFDEAWRSSAQATVRLQRGNQVFDVVLIPRVIDGILHAQGRRVSDGVAYVATFGINSNRDQFEQYVTESHALVAGLDTPATCGWILDLRRNNGGTIAPILAALGPFVGDGEIYRVRRVDGDESTILLRGGEVYREGSSSSQPYTDTPYRLRDGNVPIAVLIGPGTVSAGELSVMMVRGRAPNVRLIGGDTYGLTTTLSYVDLYDRGQIWVPVALMVGPDGRTAPYGISPDQYVPVMYNGQFGTDNDGVIQAARNWLAGQGCS
jgi:carboxyl-terminal processing protease